MDYDLYHDESQEGGYWHGILLVPRINRGKFLDSLELIRKKVNYRHPIAFGGLKRKGSKFDCIRPCLQLCVGSFMQYYKNEPYIISTGKRIYSIDDTRQSVDYKKILVINSNKKIIGSRFILFRERDAHTKVGSGYPDFTSKIETTFRMGLLGGIHYLGDKDSPIHIKSIHFDGHEHHRRNIDKKRIIDRIYSLRDYCSFDKDVLIDDKTSKHNKSNSQEYNDCQFLQLTDILIGAFRTILDSAKNDIQKEVSFPVKEIVNKQQIGYKRMKNSRWFGSFCMSECWIENDKWNFGNFKPKKNKQIKLL